METDFEQGAPWLRQFNSAAAKRGVASFLRWLDVAERVQQGLIDDPEHAAHHERQAENAVVSSTPPSPGLMEEARLRGTAVTLAAAMRSACVTTACSTHAAAFILRWPASTSPSAPAAQAITDEALTLATTRYAIRGSTLSRRSSWLS
jgi:hypothetical protein